MNLARADLQHYDIALKVALAMQLETEYAPWKSFVRNMNFLKKHLLAFLRENRDLDQNVYRVKLSHNNVYNIKSSMNIMNYSIANADSIDITNQILYKN